MSGQQEGGGPGRHAPLLTEGAVLGQVLPGGPLDIFLSTRHLARALDSMSHPALLCFFLGQKQIAHQITGGGATSVETKKIAHYFDFRFNILQSNIQTWLGYKLLCDLTARELPPRGKRKLPRARMASASARSMVINIHQTQV